MLGQLPNFKHTSIHIDFDSRKGPNPFGQGVMIPPHKLSGVAEVSGYDFNKGKGPYVLIVPDWLGQLSPFISIIKFLQNEGFRVIAFNLYETHTQGFGGGEGGGGTKSNNIAAFIFSLFAEIDQKYNPACVVSFGAGSNWVLNAFSYGIFSKNSQGGCSNILICPVDDFAEYVERICELLHIQKSAAMLESIGTRLGERGLAQPFSFRFT